MKNREKAGRLSLNWRKMPPTFWVAAAFTSSVEDILSNADDLVAGAEDHGARVAALFDQHNARLFALARRLSHDREAALDLVQDAFVRALGHRLPPDPAGAEAWLVRTLVNLCHDRHRRRLVRARDLRHELSGVAAANPEAGAVARTTVQAALATLPPRRRAVVVLAELEGRGVPEIAVLLGIAKVTVRWHLSSGRASLARFFGRTSS
jgi:RNA polymerase sigma-70 factor, ECF subfamily